MEASKYDIVGFRWKKISIVMQSALNALNPVLSIREQIHDVLKTHKNLIGLDADERAKELLSLVEIDHDRLDSFPHQLSGGQQQRIVIAMALMSKTSFLDSDIYATCVRILAPAWGLTLISWLERNTPSTCNLDFVEELPALRHQDGYERTCRKIWTRRIL